jgi:hypothetical protein
MQWLYGRIPEVHGTPAWDTISATLALAAGKANGTAAATVKA